MLTVTKDEVRLNYKTCYAYFEPRARAYSLIYHILSACNEASSCLVIVNTLMLRDHRYRMSLDLFHCYLYHVNRKSARAWTTFLQLIISREKIVLDQVFLILLHKA